MTSTAEDPVFFAHKRQTTTGSTISNIGVGTIDNDGHYWVTNGTNSPLYRSASVHWVSDVTGSPMVFDNVSGADFPTISDLAVIPTADGYLVAGFDVSTLSWGTLNTTTDVFTQGTSVTVDVGTGNFYEEGLWRSVHRRHRARQPH